MSVLRIAERSCNGSPEASNRRREGVGLLHGRAGIVVSGRARPPGWIQGSATPSGHHYSRHSGIRGLLSDLFRELWWFLGSSV